MANENPAQPQRATLEDPVGQDVLAKLGELEQTEMSAAMQLMTIEQEKVKLLAVGRRVDDERRRIFEKLLMERGLSPNTPATIDSTTGRITLVRPLTAPTAQAHPVVPPAAPPNGQS